MERENILTYVKKIVRSKPDAPREADLEKLIKLSFASFRGKVFTGMGIVFLLSGIGIIITLMNWETTVLGVIMTLFGVGLIGYQVYFAVTIHKALGAGNVCLIPSSRLEIGEKGLLNAVDVGEFKLTNEGSMADLSLKEGDRVLVFSEPHTNRILVQFNMIWEISG